MSYQQVSMPNRNGQLTNVPNPEVRPKAQRRQFTAEYKARILSEADACHIPGQIGALLRREGLYASHLTFWRRHRARGTLAGLAPQVRGPKTNPLAADNAAQSHEIARLQAKLQRAETIIAVQKKLCTLLGLPSEPDEQP
jgi:transposase